MRPAAVHQFIPTFASRDAIGQHTLALRDLLRDLGFHSEIYSADIHRELRGEALDAHHYLQRPGDGSSWLVYQMSTYSPLADALLLDRPEPLVLDYHNITPAELFAPWEPTVAVGLDRARRQLAALAPRAVLGLADSAYNAAELADLGSPRTVVAPVIVDHGRFDAEVDPALAEQLGDGGPAWLFVGRLSPNKAQHDVVKAFAAYRRVFDPTARLWLVGGSSSAAYQAAVAGLVARLGLAGAVHLAGSVTAGELAAYYRAAAVFVCLSDHEGFCVPLLEAMHHDLPVVAYASSAVPETLGRAGLCLADKSPAVVAAAVWRVVSDPVVRRALVAAGRGRLADFAPERTRAALASAILTLTGARA
jgi:glycosyltransferase involved in cell wall biosynthesis